MYCTTFISTTFLSSLLTSQHSHKRVLCSRLNSGLHLLQVAMLLFLKLVVQALSAILFWLYVTRSCLLEVRTTSFGHFRLHMRLYGVCFRFRLIMSTVYFSGDIVSSL